MVDIKCKCKVWGCAGSDGESEFERTSSRTVCNLIGQVQGQCAISFGQFWNLKDSVMADYI